MLELIDVNKSYPAVPENVRILRQVNLQIGSGQSISVMGPSGSGKTTLLNLIGGLDRPTSGKILLNRTNLGSLRDAELARIRNGSIGFVFQLHYLLPQCTVLENVLLPTLAMRKSKIEKHSDKKRAIELLEKTGMKAYCQSHPGQLSGGQRQRVAVVRALINKPDILLADEPTGSLDADTADQLTELLLELNQSQSVALVIATHSKKLANRAQRQFRLDHQTLTEV
ncbi:MAG: ABC transporter ATP-binding protein [Phycisphaerae bacterium]|nr:ABC transporter ATP-binding protein [Phycisphaerae bacterium]